MCGRVRCPVVQTEGVKHPLLSLNSEVTAASQSMPSMTATNGLGALPGAVQGGVTAGSESPSTPGPRQLGHQRSDVFSSEDDDDGSTGVASRQRYALPYRQSSDEGASPDPLQRQRDAFDEPESNLLFKATVGSAFGTRGVETHIGLGERGECVCACVYVCV